MQTQDSGVSARVKRGMEIARTPGRVALHGDLWIVRGGQRNYTVSLERESCDCPDHREREIACKHLYAVEIVAARESCRGRRGAKIIRH